MTQPSTNKWARRARLLGLLYLVAMCFGIWGFASAKYHVFPYYRVAPSLTEVEAFFEGVPEDEKNALQRLTYHRQEIKLKYDGAGMQQHDTAFTDPGYLLRSYFTPEHNQSVVDLVRLSDFKVLHTWVPPVKEILDRTYRDRAANSEGGYRAQHPLLFDDGSVVFTSGDGALVRLNADSTIQWINGGFFHHSIERDHEGNLLVCIDNRPRLMQAPPVQFRDDGWGVVTPGGELIRSYSVGQILKDNGYVGLLLGVGDVEIDRIHLNDAQPIHRDLGVARIGDVALSSRSLSTVLLYRPSSNEVVWLKTGPWFKQHDIDLLDDGRFSVYGNDTFTSVPMGNERLNPHTAVYVYDPVADTVEQPYRDVLAQIGFMSHTGGRSTILGNGDVFVEEANYARAARLSANSVRWTFINAISDSTAGLLHWCRYMPPEQTPLNWLD